MRLIGQKGTQGLFFQTFDSQDFVFELLWDKIKKNDVELYQQLKSYNYLTLFWDGESLNSFRKVVLEVMQVIIDEHYKTSNNSVHRGIKHSVLGKEMILSPTNLKEIALIGLNQLIIEIDQVIANKSSLHLKYYDDQLDRDKPLFLE